MKNMKKLASLLLALVMILALAAPALAEGETTVATTIKITSKAHTGTDNGETFNAYKIFDVVIGGGNQADANAPHSYSIEGDSPFFNTIKDFAVNGKKAFEVEQIGTTTTYNVRPTDAYDESAAAELSVKLNEVANKGEAAATTSKNENGVYTLTLGANAAGYYFITSTLGSKMIVDTVGVGQTLEITAKNDYPTLNKTITKIENGTVADGGKSGTAAYGSEVTFNIAVDVPATAKGEMVVHDVMNANLVYGTFAEKTGVTVKQSTSEAPLADGCTLEFTIDANTVKAAADATTPEGKIINITYTATVKDGAPVDGTAMLNTAHLTYSKYDTPKSEVKVYTYKFDLVKTNSKNEVITGAVFDLYKVVNEEDVLVQRDITVGTATINGLSNGNYKLVETKAPEGYNKLKDPYTFAIENESLVATIEKASETVGETTVEKAIWKTGGVHIENLTGAELPSTGGIGTTLFYIVGGLLIVGAAVLLITKKRVNGEQ